MNLFDCFVYATSKIFSTEKVICTVQDWVVHKARKRFDRILHIQIQDALGVYTAV